MAIKNCPTCGNDFKTYRLAAIYCNKSCSDLAARNRTTLTCSWCSATFDGLNRRAKHKNTFCNPACHKAWMDSLTPVKVCAFCSKEFRCLVGHKTQLYCSHQCWYKSKKTSQQVSCSHCGKLIEVIKFKIKTQSRYFCSRKCFDKANQGSGNAAWRGGHKKYKGANWEKQSLKCRTRDKFTCQSCGNNENGTSFAAHHRTPFRYFDGNYERANRLCNLVTLCTSCHSKIEWAITRHRIHTIPEHCRPLKTHLKLLPPANRQC